MKLIRKTFNIDIPEDFLHDNIETPKYQDWEYIGEDVIYVYVSKETNIADKGTISDIELNDGRPIPLDKYLVKIEAEKEPLIASLLHGPRKRDNAFELSDTREEILVDSHEEYGEYKIPKKYHLSELISPEIKYDPENKKWSYKFLKHTDIIGVDELTWDMLRGKRDNALIASDGRESGDMPEKIITELREYRQKLRDFPNKLADKDPWVAYNMFPNDPFGKK